MSYIKILNLMKSHIRKIFEIRILKKKIKSNHLELMHDFNFIFYFKKNLTT
jgi:hypothetical protein